MSPSSHSDVVAVRAKVQRRFERVLIEPEMAKKLEICLWNWTLKTSIKDGIPLYWENKRFRYRYTTRALSLVFNLRTNPDLSEKIARKEVGLKRYVDMSPEEMRPDIYKPIYEALAKKNLKKMIPLDAHDAPDGAHTCRKCKSRKTVYTQLQTRSADEPMTTFVHCLSCGQNWKH